MILFIMKMKFQSFVLLSISFASLLFLVYVKRSFDWLLGLEQQQIVKLSPSEAIEEELEKVYHIMIDESVL